MTETNELLVRPIRQKELQAFAAFSAGPDRGFAPEAPHDFREWLVRLWTSRLSEPGRCFVAESADPGRLLGTVVYWGPPQEPQHLEHLHVRPGRASGAVRERLIDGSARLLATNGFPSVYVLLVAPPLSLASVSRWKATLGKLGFHLRTEGYRYEWRSDRRLPPLSARLRFRTLKQVGVGAWRDADAHVRQGSLDPPDEVRSPRDLPNTAIWWRLAYDSEGHLVGLVQPGEKIEGGATIEWIGVVPEQRGRGYVHELLAAGMATLTAAGADKIRADTHMRNRAMQRAFRQAGFDRLGARWWYERACQAP